MEYKYKIGYFMAKKKLERKDGFITFVNYVKRFVNDSECTDATVVIDQTFI